jgi:oligoendopeptidase F
MALVRTCAIFLLCLVYCAAQERDRSKIPEKYKWNLDNIYPNVAAWRAAKEKLAADIPQMRRFEGKLASSASALSDALDLRSQIQKELARVSSYASMLQSQDTRASEPQGMMQEIQQVATSYAAASSYIAPEILKAGAATIEDFIASEPRLKDYGFYLRDVLRRAPHTLSDGEEKLLASATRLSSAPRNMFNIFTNADFPHPSVAMSGGRTVKLDRATYQELRVSPNRADREKATSTYMRTVGSFTGTLGTAMNANLQSAVFFANARKYPTTLEASLGRGNIPLQVYTGLIEAMNAALPSYHRYLRLRKRLMGVDELHYYDVSAPLVPSAKLKYTPEEARDVILAAVATLGPEYVSVARRAFAERWIDLLPNDGKSSGAYANSGVYDVHPYVSMNFLGRYADVSTLAHELGHAMHGYLSNKTQPYLLAGHPIFLAEVASTFNEALLIDHMLRQNLDDTTRLSLLGDYLDNMRLTLFRQAQLAEFELRMHERAQKGLALTGDVLSKSYLDIARKYHGHHDGVCIIDDYVAHEWAVIPHFYTDFYVYQYATSYTAAAALSEKVLTGDEAAKKRYLTFLSSGGSKYPVETLKDAGVDLTTGEPLALTIRKMNRVMDEIEKLLDKRTASK